MHNYKKHYKKDGSFVLKEYREDGKIRVVGEDNSCYLEFSKHFIPEDVEYIAPVIPEPVEIIRIYSKLKLVRELKKVSTEETPIYSQFKQILIDNDVEDEFYLAQELSSNDELFQSMLAVMNTMFSSYGIDVDTFLDAIEV